jgi:hypothetical protein
MFNSVVVRRLLVAQRGSIIAQNQRLFTSCLLVPLQAPTQLPSEAVDTPLTNAEFQELEVTYRDFNIRCGEELKEMHQNRITNIIDRGGINGWETVIKFNLYYITGKRIS